MSPLIDDFFLSELRHASDDAKRFGLIAADAEMSTDGWVEPNYVDRALRELGLKGFWPESDGEGKRKNVQVSAHD